ncbi:MAG: (2Fe-2S) ferredoxin domain-containing protein [Oscillospiraceae bacterium]
MDLTICVGSSCHLQHSREIIREFQGLITRHQLQEALELKGSFCMGHCAEEGVCVKFNGQIYGVTPSSADGFFEKQVLPCCPQP